MESASGKPITQIAHDFTLQPGVPLIRVSGTCHGGTTTLALTQGEFTKDRPGKPPLTWHVPVIAAAVGGQAAETVVQGKADLAVRGCGPVIVNAGQSGYYRTLYDPALFAAIARDFAKVAPIDQIGILNDAAALGLGGLEPVSDALDLGANLPADADPQVLTSAIGLVNSLAGSYARGVPTRQAALARYASSRFLPALKRLGWVPVKGEADTVANLRSSLITALGTMGEPSVVAEANRRFAAAQSDPSAIPSTLRKSILSVVAYNADAATWDKLRAMAKAERSALVKASLYALLGAVKDPALADKALALALTDEPGATTSPGMIGAVSYEHPDKAFDFAIAHQKAVEAKVDTSSLSRFIPHLASGSYDPAMLGKVRTWAAANLPKTAMRSADETVAAIQYRIQVRNERMPAVDRWLKSKGY
jgi:aminopeptidase N